METNLAKELTKYYKRTRHKILFRNGTTLNQIAIDLWSRLGFKSIESSVISRVINSQRLFTPRQLEIFCDVIKTTNYERWNLRNALYKDYYLKYGLEIEPALSPYFLDLITTQLRKISEIRILGNPDLAIEFVSILTDQLEMLVRNSPQKSLKPFLKILAELLLEKTIIYRETILPQKALPTIRPMIKKVREIAKTCEDRELLGRADFYLGCAYYVAEKYDISLQLFRKSLSLVKNINYKLEILRGFSLDFAYLQEKDEFLKIETQARELIKENQSSRISSVCELLEGIARAQGLLKIQKAFKTLDETRNINTLIKNKKTKVFLRDIQLVRTHLEIVKYLAPKEKNFLEQIGVKGFNSAMEHGYQRHAVKIKKLLEECL